MIYEGIRGELDLAAAEWFKLSGKMVDLGDCWDRFFRRQNDGMASFARAFVKKAMEELAAKWVDGTSKDEIWCSKVKQVEEILEALGSKIGEIYSNGYEAEVVAFPT
ncbi:CAZyme family GH18 [Penicillium canescens]|nr:CAZyme family GH18 [Penicillium canescens]KAJ6165241.1 CAZyme family GH18 [Penicillium canescens]